jgi:hypothetical protein
LWICGGKDLFRQAVAYAIAVASVLVSITSVIVGLILFMPEILAQL